MKSEQLEKHLKRFRFSTPAPELRRQILTSARAAWSSERKAEISLFSRLCFTARVWMRTLRLKHAVAAGIFALLLIVVIFRYENLARVRIDFFEQIKSASFLSTEISKNVEKLALSYAKWGSNDEKRKMIIESIQKRFSTSEVTNR